LPEYLKTCQKVVFQGVKSFDQKTHQIQKTAYLTKYLLTDQHTLVLPQILRVQSYSYF